MRELTASEASPAAASALADSDALVRADTLALLIRQAFPAMFQSLAVGGLMCWALWGLVEQDKLFTWLGVLGLSSAVRLVMHLLYFRAKPVGLEILVWERPYAITLAFSSLVWGLGAVWLMPPQQAVAQFVILFFVVGLVGASTFTYSAHRGMTLIAMMSVLLPSTVWLYFQPGHITLALAIAATIFMMGALRATKMLATAMQASSLLGHELKRTNAVADHMARTDVLTGIPNRRSFMELGEQMSRMCKRQDSPLSALLIDVDHFKNINDTHGHGAGDLVLQHLGALLDQQFRAADLCGRIGGEEFAVLLADTDGRTAASVAEKLRRTVASETIAWQAHILHVTVSIGVATHSHHLGTLLQNADAAMYQAKNSGRNRVVRHTDAAG